MAHPPSEPEVKRKHPYTFPHPYVFYNEKYVEYRKKVLDIAEKWLNEHNYCRYADDTENLKQVLMVADFLMKHPKWRKPFHALGKKVPKKALDIEKIPTKKEK